MFGLGFGEVLVILVVALLVFGPDKLPELARTLGKTMAELRRSMDDMKTEFRGPIQDFERTLRSEPSNPQSAQNLGAQNLGAPNVATPRLDSADVPKAPLTEVKIEPAPASPEKSTAEVSSDSGNTGAEGSHVGGPGKGNVNETN